MINRYLNGSKGYKLGKWGEQTVCNTLRRKGWNPLLSPGSRGPADINATNGKKKWCIQVKTRTTDNGRILVKSEERRLVRHSLVCGCIPVVALVTEFPGSLLRVASNKQDPTDQFVIRDVLDNFVGINLEKNFVLFFLDLRTGRNLEP